MKIKPIQTKFDDYRFRSRIEARWAVMLKGLHVKYEYEKEGYNLNGTRYLPDFWLPIDSQTMSNPPGSGYWLEIKGTPPSQKELDLCEALVEATKHNCFLAVGPPKDDSVSMWKWAIDRQTNRVRCVYENLTKRPEEVCHPIFIQIETCCSNSDPGSWVKASEKAMSARFEHGEKP